LLGSGPIAYRDELLKKHGDVGVQMYHSFGSEAGRAIAGSNLARVFGSTTRAELEWIVKNELVTDIEDVLMRRTRLSFLVGKAESLSLAALIGELLQKELGWSNKERDQKVRESV
jgi:glycerol-3-phosphate dehydrogenase